MSTRPELPDDVERLVDELAAMPGVVGVVLGGSRAAGEDDAGSDWDLGVYYREPLDLGALRRWGEVHPPGSWGRIMNGGAWLSCGGARVDVILRDVDVVATWTERAERGEYEVDLLLGYLAGIPTYTLPAECAAARPLRGEAPRPIEYPAALSDVARAEWRFRSRFTLEHARARARRGDLVGTAGQAAKAVIEEAHARLCERRVWVCNEKRIVERAALEATQALFREPPSAQALPEWVERLSRALDGKL